MKSESCPACEGQWPRGDHRIKESRLTVAFLHDDQFFPGWTLLVLKRHAQELFELPRDDRNQLMEEISTMAETLAEVFQAVKINYALLGNQLPHIHWHLIPRLAGDPALQDPVWSIPHEPRRLAHELLQERIDRIAAAVALRWRE